MRALAHRRDPLCDERSYRPQGRAERAGSSTARYAPSGSMSSLAQHGAAIANPSLAGGTSAAAGDGWVMVVQATLSVAIVLALAILWWRTLRPPRARL